MYKGGPIILIEDDKDDQDLISEIIHESAFKNDLLIFENGKDAYDYLTTKADKPFLIICDVNMPVMNGLELRRNINDNENLRKKSIPFVFLSTSGDKRTVDEAYDLTVQGFFVKPSNFKEFHHMIHSTLQYWDVCLHPVS